MPRAPLALCAGALDPTVYGNDASVMQADFARRGADMPRWNPASRGRLPARAGGGAPPLHHGERVPPLSHALALGFFAGHITS